MVCCPWMGLAGNRSFVAQRRATKRPERELEQQQSFAVSFFTFYPFGSEVGDTSHTASVTGISGEEGVSESKNSEARTDRGKRSGNDWGKTPRLRIGWNQLRKRYERNTHLD